VSRIKNHYLLFVPLLLLFITSCEKFEGSQVIPVYIRVDSFNLDDNSLIEEGPLTMNISDVWVYVDDQIIGAFELPAVVPVLAEGKHKLTLYPGIKYNGIAGTRGPYKFLDPDIEVDFEFVIDSIAVTMPSTHYNTNSNFVWLEDFEDGTISLKPIPQSDTSLQIINYDPPHQFYGNHSGVGYLNDEYKLLMVSTMDDDFYGGFVLPTTGTHVFLEMEYSTNNILTVGLIIRQIGLEIKTHPIIVLYPTDENWKKIYINLTPTVSSNPYADYFYVFIRAEKESSVDEAVIKLDNFKLIY